MTIGGSKLTKRAEQPEMHDRVSQPGFQSAGKFSAGKSASHHFQNTSFVVTEMKVKVRKRMD